MIWLYRLLFPPLLLIVLPYYLFRMIKRGGYRQNFLHRFGLIGAAPKGSPEIRRIWIQAVSVGEVLAVEPLLQDLARDQGTEIVLTTTTSTAYRLACDRFAEETVAIGYFPLDFQPFSATAWNRIAPDLAILMENELWPEHIHQASRRKTPIALVNARLADRSYNIYRHIPSFTRAILAPFRAVLAASDGDAQRFVAVGADPSVVITTGNLKLDAAIDPLLSTDEIDSLKSDLGFTPTRAVSTSHAQPHAFPLIILGASTWPGEEAALVSLLKEALARDVDYRLLLVPRHAERRAGIEAELAATGLTFHFRSRGVRAPAPVMVHVADTTGELATLTQCADVVFVGKSLPPHTGGQTPVEAAALGKPVIFGPGMDNFREISRDLVARGAALSVSSAGDLAPAALRLLGDPGEREKMSVAARKWHRANHGVAERIRDAIDSVVPVCARMPANHRTNG